MTLWWVAADLFEGQRDVAEPPVANPLRISQDQLGQVMDRMGQVVLAVKHLFDTRCGTDGSDEPTLSADQAAGAPLDYIHR